MNELYAEALAKQKTTVGVIVLKILAILMIILIFLIALFLPGGVRQVVFMLGGFAVVLLMWYWPRFSREWEYVFCDGQLDFDMIQGGEKRKNVLRIEIGEADVIAKMDSQKMDGYRHLEVKDFTSLQKDANIYGIVIKMKDEKVVLLFEPTSKMLDMMHTKYPDIVEI